MRADKAGRGIRHEQNACEMHLDSGAGQCDDLQGSFYERSTALAYRW
jgi:hypothetical protein